MSKNIRTIDNAGSAAAWEGTLTEAQLASELESVNITVVVVTGNTAISAAHQNKIVQVNKATNVTLTLPATLTAGFSFVVDQVGAGLAIFAAASGGSIVNRQSFDRTAGTGALMNAYVRSNSDGASAVWVIGGDGATA